MKHPQPHTALGHAATAEAMAGYRRRAWRLLGVGLLATVVVTAGGTAADSAGLGALSGLAASAVGGALILVGIGVAGVFRARRMRRVLASGPWTACAAEGFVHRDQAPTVVLKDPATGVLRALSTDNPRCAPDALLRLHGRGRRRRRRSAAWQVAPVGRCALHGGTQGHDLAVPWIDGRPLWPQGSRYWINPANQADKVKLQALMSA